MDLLKQFKEDKPNASTSLLNDVRAYLNWQAERGQDEFIPGVEDDVDLRTYLLHLRLRGASRSSLESKLESLEHFYDWAKRIGLAQGSPFDEFDFQRPFLSRKEIKRRQEIFAGKQHEREIARLKALNHLATQINRSPDVKSALDAALGTLVEVMEMKTAWAFIQTSAGVISYSLGEKSAHDFALVSEENLPPGLERRDRYYLKKPPDCHCQSLLRKGKMERAVNIVECTRLQSSAKADGENRGLLFHASVPLIVQGKPAGVMNFATDEWQFLSAADLQLLSTAGEQVSIALERAHLFELTRAQKDRLENELEMARRVQVSLLPQALTDIPGFGLAVAWRAMRQMAGDFYDVFKLPDGRWGLLIADVADKGAPAALFMAMTSSLLRSRAHAAASPAKLLAQVNNGLCTQSHSGMFVTMFYCILDPANLTLTYASAGHPPSILRRKDGQIELLEKNGMALGVLPEAVYTDETVRLETGDILVAYTDGIIDALNEDGQEYGEDRLSKVVQSAGAPAQRFKDDIMEDLDRFTQDAQQYDDITLFVLEAQ